MGSQAETSCREVDLKIHLKWLALLGAASALLLALAFSISPTLDPSSGPRGIDCRYENPELHMYVDRIEVCMP